MPLIKCPECGHEISTYADKCIYCGCPMDVAKALLNGIEKTACTSKITPKENK